MKQLNLETLKMIFSEKSGILPEEISDTEPLLTMAGIDSLTLLQFMVALEKEYNVSFEMEEVEKAFASMKDLQLAIEKKI